MWVQSLQLCPTLCDPVDCSPPFSSVHEILQARILEWVAMPSSRWFSWPRDRTHVSYVSCTDRRGCFFLFVCLFVFTTNATWKAFTGFFLRPVLGVCPVQSTSLSPWLVLAGQLSGLQFSILLSWGNWLLNCLPPKSPLLLRQLLDLNLTTFCLESRQFIWSKLLRKWQPSPVLLPGKSHGWRSMVGYSPWSCKELDTTEQLNTYTHSLTLWSSHYVGLSLSLPLSKVSETLLQSQGLGEWAASLGLTSRLSELVSRRWRHLIFLALCSCYVPSTSGGTESRAAAFCNWGRASVLWGWVAGIEKESLQPLFSLYRLAGMGQWWYYHFVF